MQTSWPTTIPAGTDIELNIGRLQCLFFSRAFEWKVCLFLSFLPLTACVIAFTYYLTQPFATAAAVLSCITFVIFLVLAGLTWWYRRQVKYFCLCDKGCAFGQSFSAAPVVLPWEQVQAITMEDEAYLKVEQNSILGLKISETAQEASRNWLHIKGPEASIRLKLSEYPERKLLVEKVLEHSSELAVSLDHSRVETPELQQAKAAGNGNSLGKTTYYAIGVVVVILFIILRVVAKMNR